MKEMLQIYCKNNGKTVEVGHGANLIEVYEKSNVRLPYGPTSARVNNVMEGLTFRLFHNMDVEFLDVTSALCCARLYLTFSQRDRSC